jgi:hypothetical protein
VRFRAELTKIKHDRDKFVAHLDNLRKRDVPWLDFAYECVAVYYPYIVANELIPGTMRGLPRDFRAAYRKSWRSERGSIAECLTGWGSQTAIYHHSGPL